MNGNSRLMTGMGQLLLALFSLALLAKPSFAQTDVFLVAREFVKVMPDTDVPMWGFARAGNANCPPAETGILEGPSSPGPRIVVPPDETTLNIHLCNELPEPVSIVIPGMPGGSLTPVWQDGTAGPRPDYDPATFDPAKRVYSFTHETAPGTSGLYTWSAAGGLKPGSHIYHSGTHPSVQMPMGLYGALTKTAPSGEAYSGVPYDNEVLFFYSEIDPILNDTVATGRYGTTMTSTIDYAPKYFLLNGETYPNAAPLLTDPLNPVQLDQIVLARFFNVGLKTHVPTFQNLFVDVISEDGNVYPFPMKQYSVRLPAGRTADAILSLPGSSCGAPLYDRRLYLTDNGAFPGGLFTYLNRANPGATDDYYYGGQGATLSVSPAGILGNDYGCGTNGALLTASVVSPPASGTVSCPNPTLIGNVCPDGSFEYTPNDFAVISDSFTYTATASTFNSNIATVSIELGIVNAAPVAANDSYPVSQGSTLAVPAPGVLDNDTDTDFDPLTAHLIASPTGGTLFCPGTGLNEVCEDGSFEYTPDIGTTFDSFTYVANDGTVDGNVAVVSLMISSAIEVRIAAGSDDAEESASGSVNLTSSDLELTFDGSDQTVGMRFNGLTIPQGATISRAYIQFQVDETPSGPTSLTIFGEDIDNAPTFTSTSQNISSRTPTAATVGWNPDPWPTVGEALAAQQTPDIASIIQEIVDRPGWTSGNSLAVIITGTGERVAESYNGVAAAAPMLHVEYSVYVGETICNDGTDNDGNGLTDCEDPNCNLQPCDDGQFCTANDICQGVACTGSPRDCSDGVGCTDDSCDEATDSCVNLPNDLNCPDDGLFCNGTEYCDPAADCSSTGIVCGPGEICNEGTDSCVAVECTTDGDCDDGTFCNGAETCNPSTFTCEAGVPPACDDGVGCTDDSCDATTDSCVYAPNDGNCPDDGLFCNGLEYCDAVTDCTSAGDPCPAGTTCQEGTDSCSAAPPASIEVRVAAGSDDAEERASGSVNLTSSDLELTYDRSDQTVGMRFNGLTIPQGATISRAYIQFQVDETPSGPTSLTIFGEDIDNAATFTSTSQNISSRTPTAATVGWVPDPWPTVGDALAAQQTPDIASIIQEIVDRPGWTSGNSLVVIITGTGERVAESYDGNPTAAPLLHVEHGGP